MASQMPDELPLGSEMPEGIRFIGAPLGAIANWAEGDAPAEVDLNTCVSCGLCLPHCPTYRVTRDETASPRGRINAMRAVSEGRAELDDAFSSFMDLCLVCRACEDVCPSHVPFGRMMERARAQIEPRRSIRSRFVRWVGFHWVLPHPSLVRAVAFLQPVAYPFLSERVRALLPRDAHPFAHLPIRSDPPAGVEVRGTVAMLAGCAQDRWFHEVNVATIRVLTRNGWRVTVPRTQACCGALAAHNGRLAVARRMARRARHAFSGADVVVVNAAGCSAHMKGYAELDEGAELPVRDLTEFLFEEGLVADHGPMAVTVAYHDACHAVRAQAIKQQPRALLGAIPDLVVVDVPEGDRCCGAAGTYNLTEPEMADVLMREKAAAVASTGATIVASANPGCSMQLAAGLKMSGGGVEILHPVQLLDRAERIALES
jgi:glycolate dehydrogenase iron-sulfur subunit